MTSPAGYGRGREMAPVPVSLDGSGALKRCLVLPVRCSDDDIATCGLDVGCTGESAGTLISVDKFRVRALWIALDSMALGFDETGVVINDVGAELDWDWDDG